MTAADSSVDPPDSDCRCGFLSRRSRIYTYRLGKLSLSCDESASFVNASLSWHDFGIAMHHRDVFFAAYYALLHLWTAWGSDEATLRMPSVIGAVAALPCMFALGSRLFGNRVGLVAMILLASNNLFILHVREAQALCVACVVCDHFFAYVLTGSGFRQIA